MKLAVTGERRSLEVQQPNVPYEQMRVQDALP